VTETSTGPTSASAVASGPTPAPMRVQWGLVGTFYAIAFGIACVITALVVAAGGNLLANRGLQLLVAFLYMPAPLVAGLVVEAIRKRGFLITRVFKGFGPRIVRVLLVGIGWWTFLMVGFIGGAFLLGNVLRIPGIGVMPTSQAELLRATLALVPAGIKVTPAQLATLPPWWTLYLYVAIAGILAGATINALFAFGEEYGWRGVLQNLLAPLGAFRANILIGLMWGFWHAPLIVMTGYNFPGQPLLGTLMMMLACIPFAFVEYQARRLTGSLLGPAVVHGLFNAMAGVFLFSLARNALVSFPLGLAGAAMLALAAWIVASLPIEPLPLLGSDGAYPQDRMEAPAE
jgi:membrane protease YdiL (CAAX protease family)